MNAYVALFIGGLLFGAIGVLFVGDMIDANARQQCAKSHDVYQCQKVITFVPKQVTSEGE